MAETVDTKPVFREAFQRRRCIVPVDNFYEWKKLGPKEKTAVRHRAGGSLGDGPRWVVGDLEVSG
jgi:putative SOS response-associated peptidase YedK